MVKALLADRFALRLHTERSHFVNALSRYVDRPIVDSTSAS
jgi:hypothetical protein